MIGNKELNNMLAKYKVIFRNELPYGLAPEIEVDHTIELEPGMKPPNRPLYQLSPAELDAVKEYVQELLQAGKIRRKKSPYGASRFIVREPENLRCVVDYRALNRITKRNSTPIPRCTEMFERLGEAKYFSKLDLKSGFHQITACESDIEKNSFKTRYGQFKYLVMAMGLCSAPATFQILKNTLLHDCMNGFVFVYMDYLLIFSKTPEDQITDLDTVLSRLKK